ncbi:hypothetical protein BGW80DRAFT_528875 [Lactifluus volemus]|nr:hypothetical protein BGW80DRAFT_528875 [Lactifluus volemus]
MSQPTNRVVDVEDNARERVETNGDTNVPQSAQHQPSQDQFNFSDGSGPLFNMYVERAEKEDKGQADRWQKDADGILIFVSLHISLYRECVEISIMMNIIDRVILCCSCSIGRGVHPRLEAKSTGYFRILSRKDLPATR